MNMPAPMKENELRKHLTCSACRKKIMHTGVPLFWTVTVNRYGIRADRVKRQDGLAAFMGSTVLANIMGTDEDMAEPVMDTVTLTLCEACACDGAPPIAAMVMP